MLSKPYFDNEGLLVALDGGNLLGFAHSGFGPNQDETALAMAQGVTCLVMLRPDADRPIGSELLSRAEAYLRSRGATTLCGGASFPLSPFYYGLYGGSEPSGVLSSDPRMQAIFLEAGYHPQHVSVVLRRDLAQFRPAVDRQQMQIRRHNTFQVVTDPPTSTWWEACMFEPFDRTLCLLTPRGGGPPGARVFFWNMETMVGAWA